MNKNMIIKFNKKELAALRGHELGPFGEDTFESYMSEICARTNGDELDFDRDDYEKMQHFSGHGHSEEIDQILTRPVEIMLREFFGEAWNS